MSTKAVIIALLIALVLGIGAYVALQPPAKPAAAPALLGVGEQVFAIDPGLVNSIEIETPDGTVQRLVKGERGVYSLRVSRQSVPDGPAWPIEEGRVTNLLRRLQGARALDTPDAEAAIDADAARVTIRQENGVTIHALLNARTLTGRGLVKIVAGEENDRRDRAALLAAQGKVGLVEDDIHNVFRQPGPRAWRDTTAIPGMGPDVSRLFTRHHELTTRLARVDGRWVLQDPTSAPADAERVTRLLATLGALRITSFNDEPGVLPPGADVTGLNDPLVIVESETDRRILHADPSAPAENSLSTRTERSELRIGKPADAQAQTRYAMIGKDGPVVIISGAGLTREAFDPVQYIARTAAQTSSVDIGMLVIEPAPPAPAPPTPVPSEGSPAPTPPTPTPVPTIAPKVFRRDVDTWKEVTGTTEVVLDQTLSKAMQDLLRFLTAEPAASIALQQPAVWRDQGQLVIGSLAGSPLETLTIGATDGANLGIKTTGPSGSVYRWFPREKVPALLIPLLPRPTESVPVPAGVAEKDVVK